MSRQVRTKSTSARGVVHSAAFRQGYEDAVNDRPWRDLDSMNGGRRLSATDTMWNYERGRYFAHYLKGEGVRPLPLKDRRGRVTTETLARVSQAIRCGAFG